MSSQAPLGCSPMTFSMVVSSSVLFSDPSCSQCFHKRTPLQTWWNSHIMYAVDARPAPRKYRPPAKNRALSHPADCKFYRYPFSLHFRRGQFSPPTSPSQLWSLLIQVLKHNFFSGHCQNLCFIPLFRENLLWPISTNDHPKCFTSLESYGSPLSGGEKRTILFIL